MKLAVMPNSDLKGSNSCWTKESDNSFDALGDGSHNPEDIGTMHTK